MKYTIFSITLFSFLFLFSSCSDDTGSSSNTGMDCVFEQIDENKDGLIDETERSLMEECRENKYSSKSEIVDNLIGEWQLIGHGEGWIPTVSQPCGYVTFTEEEYTLEYDDGSTDIEITSTWDIDVIESPAGTFFRFDLDGEFTYPLSAAIFCPKYFYGDATPVDGNMYLWEKVE